jgi:hypothetical protein
MAYFGIYRGSVMNTADPTMKGRIQVSVASVGASSGSWALPCRDFGSKAVPPVGSAVWVMFEAGNVTNPVWLGCMT